MKYYRDFELSLAAKESHITDLLSTLEEGFLAYHRGEILLPEKSSQILDSVTQSRVNCMPCTAPNIGVSGVKLVSVFPKNYLVGKKNVSGLVVLLSSTDGSPVAILDAGYLTALRTALVGGLAARNLAVREPRRLGLIGSGAEAYMHLFVMAQLFPTIDQVVVASRNPDNEKRFADAARRLFPDLDIYQCEADYKCASVGSDIVVTAISGQSPILKADWIGPGVFYCHVGGVEDEYAVALKADKIVCDSWGALKHRGSPTLAHMYAEGILTDDSIYAELAELISGEKPGRENDSEFIYFNSIGMALTDIYSSVALIKKCDDMGMGVELESTEFDIFNLE